MTPLCYHRFRKAGYPAVQAYRNAKLLVEWDDLEAKGLVRLLAESDEHFDPDILCDCGCGDREAYERDGAWGVVGQYRLDTESDWQTGDSIWGCVGYRDVLSPFENWYVPDIMHETLAALGRE